MVPIVVCHFVTALSPLSLRLVISSVSQETTDHSRGSPRISKASLQWVGRLKASIMPVQFRAPCARTSARGWQRQHNNQQANISPNLLALTGPMGGWGYFPATCDIEI